MQKKKPSSSQIYQVHKAIDQTYHQKRNEDYTKDLIKYFKLLLSQCPFIFSVDTKQRQISLVLKLQNITFLAIFCLKIYNRGAKQAVP